jgi:hypothetical protein
MRRHGEKEIFSIAASPFLRIAVSLHHMFALDAGDRTYLSVG